MEMEFDMQTCLVTIKKWTSRSFDSLLFCCARRIQRIQLGLGVLYGGRRARVYSVREVRLPDEVRSNERRPITHRDACNSIEVHNPGLWLVRLFTLGSWLISTRTEYTCVIQSTRFGA